MAYHFQCRFAKRLDGRTVRTLPTQGSMYTHGQKTLKSCDTLEEAITAAKEFNSSLSPEIIGLVIVQYKANGHYKHYNKPSHKPGIRHSMRREGSTEWLRFINRKGEVFELDPKTHMILDKL